MSDPNFRALFEFRSRWKHLSEARTGGRFVLDALVTVDCPKHSVEDESAVTITTHAGPTDGCILIADTDVLNQNYIHLYFDPRYQNYSFDDEDGSLTVEGSSPKMGGAYSVIIQPEE